MSSNNNLNEEEEILFFYEDPKSFDEKNLYEVNRAPWFYHLINVLGLTKDNFMEIKHMVEDKKNNILNLINYKSYTDNYLKKNDTMKNMLCAYLYSCKTSLYEYSKNINSEQNIHFVFTFGNITADLTNLIGKKKDDPLMFFIPVINIKKNDMKLKILIIWWLEKCGIENPEELLIFNDDLNLLEVLKNDTKYDTCLVDFNKSENNCVYNINNIKSIIDHHILNEEMKNKKITKSVFPIYVCSCMYKYSSEFLGISLLNRDIMWLIYGTMLKDSNNFPKDDFRKRWIQSLNLTNNNKSHYIMHSYYIFLYSVGI
ncbi:exopolyphosphatase [Plasmodium falciparum IGH-CR14]|uniref:Exopolyphosphatase n=1 Tax=Plasmodium falciparum IGH-CR14 TaxID=580059 RepID=A0A0L1IHK2_PLAFA|nr:exopolyphosphatase [Plasmodium falciparum IGH-CR14]